MNKIAKIVFFFIFLFITISLNSQPRVNITDRVDRLTEELDLSQEQQKDLTKILTKQKEKMEDLRNESNGDRSAVREMMGELFKDTNDQILNILNDDQKEKFNKIVEEQRNRRQNRSNRNNTKAQTEK